MIDGRRGLRRTEGRRRIPPSTSESIADAYQKDVEQKAHVIERVALVKQRLLFVSKAMERLLSDDQFVALLQREGLITLPRSFQKPASGEQAEIG